jgi:FkbM family methyltransferase
LLRAFRKNLSSARRRRAASRIIASDRAGLAFYGAFIGAGSLCFDVGANVGNRIKLFRRLGAKVIAIEPQPSCADFLERTYCRDPNVTVKRVALGREAGETDFYVADYDTVSSMNPEWIDEVKRTGRFGDIQWNERIRVPVATLDGLIADFGVPDFVKIDVEGAEHIVLSGLSRPIPMLSIEVTPEYSTSASACLRHMAALGRYEFNFSEGENFAWALPDFMPIERAEDYIRSLKDEPTLFGDAYLRLLP